MSDTPTEKDPAQSAVDSSALFAEMWREHALAAEEKMTFMVMPRDYWDGDWDEEMTHRWNEVRERHYNAKLATSQANAGDRHCAENIKPNQ